MSIQVHEVHTLRQLKQFIDFPYQLYHKHPCWVPPIRMDEINTLRKDKNPAFEHCQARYWLAKRENKIVGRVAGIINQKYLDTWGKKYLRFGWIDFEDDLAISQSLMAVVEQWATELGMEAVHGPLGFTDLDYEGMLVEGFLELGTLAAIYNHPYYPNHLESLGYKKDIDWVEFEIRPPREIPERMDRIANVAMRRLHLHVLRARHKKQLLSYVPQIFEMIDEAYQHLYGVVPLTPTQVSYYTKMYFGFIKPDYVSIILDEHGKLAAFGITMPSLSKALQKCRGKLLPFGFIHLLKAMKKNDTADLYLVGVRPSLQGKGINAIMIREINKIYARHNIQKVESNPELETNRNVQGQWKYYEHRQHKRRRCYIKKLI
ncbi:GNAT family N-acetyltransferase [bacterium]|nr:GNAT family N-acetyltransferase [bacterium]